MYKYSIVIPMYNESYCIKKNVENILLPYLTMLKINYELILVNDGSKDSTYEIAKSIEGVKVISYEENGGKGKAVKVGIEAASGDYIIFMDADMSSDIKMLESFIEKIGDNDIAIGSRHMKTSIEINRPKFFRRLMSLCCAMYTKILFGFKYKDTQCGFKMYKKDVAKMLVKLQLINNYAFDVEHLYIAKLKKLKCIELPAIFTYNNIKSTVSPIKASWKFFNDCMKIKRNKKVYLGIKTK